MAADGDDNLVDPLAATTATPGAITATPDPLAQTISSSPPDGARTTTAPASFADASSLGRYTDLARIGAGAMGVVYRASDSELGRHVALKLLKRPDAELTERLVREARAMARVSHPNVVAVYDVGVIDGSTYIAMELVTGSTLRAWQQQRSVAEIVAAYAGAGRGLAAAHDAGIVHRDFKPDNVLVGEDGRARVTDFGLAASRAPAGQAARSLPPGAHELELTSEGTVLGTPAYMAPEQFTGGNIDSRTDQYCFCVALYEALVGQRPFAGKTFGELGDNVCNGVMRALPAGSRLAPALRTIVMRGLSVKPGDRFPTMDHLVAELGRDRARPWRYAGALLAVIASLLTLALVADAVVRDRGDIASREAFRATGVQTTRAVADQRENFFARSNVAYHQSAMREVAGHHDLEDFGLGSGAADRDDLARVHGLIAASDWKRPEDKFLDVAIADAKGRLIYSTASAKWGDSLEALPEIRHAIDTGNGAGVTVLPYANAATTGVIDGDHMRTGIAVIYDRALGLGADATDKESRALYLEIIDGAYLLDQISLGDTLLALVAPSGEAIGDVPAGVIVDAPTTDDQLIEIRDGGQVYLVQSRAIADFEASRAPVARVVMARPVSGVLALFPHARTVLGIALIASLWAALWAAWRARRIARA